MSFKATAWYCNDCGGNFLPSGDEPVTCTCEPGPQRFNYSVGNGTYTPPNDGLKRSYTMIGGGGSGYGYPSLSIATGEGLDILANIIGISRQYGESDSSLRERARDKRLGYSSGDPHAGHEIIENTAAGKKFKYCRVCKTEVV